jgi:hypothetical protein
MEIKAKSQMRLGRNIRQGANMKCRYCNRSIEPAKNSPTGYKHSDPGDFFDCDNLAEPKE